MFYDVFRRLCAQRGEAETSVCRKIGISPANPMQWRNGIDPKPSTRLALAKYFGVDVGFFDEPFPEAPILDEPRYGVRVITQEESDLLLKIQKLSNRERRAIIHLVEELCEQSDI